MNCPNCGTSNLDNASICVNCGKVLSTTTPHTYTPPPPSRPATASYGTPPPPAGESIPNYLVQSILATICCCLPLGIVAIVFAAQVNSKLAVGDIAGAREASSKAKLFCWIAFGLGIVVMILYSFFFASAGTAFLQGVRDGMENR